MAVSHRSMAGEGASNPAASVLYIAFDGFLWQTQGPAIVPRGSVFPCSGSAKGGIYYEETTSGSSFRAVLLAIPPAVLSFSDTLARAFDLFPLDRAVLRSGLPRRYGHQALDQDVSRPQ
jgi:hypothetical protein